MTVSAWGKGWDTRPLDECMAAIIDYRGKTPTKTSAGVPLVTAKVVKGGRIEPPTEFIASGDYDAWMRRGLPLPGDLVVTTEAPLGEVAQLDGQKVALAQRLICLRGKADLLDNTFLKFLFQSAFVQDQLRARATGTTVLGIRQSELRRVSLLVPPLEEQRAIANVLGALDDKIELNRRINETLEAMARALFKSWFIDFDPVRAKTAGRAPAGMDAMTADLFPSTMEENERLPVGWSICPLGEMIELAYGRALRAEERRPGPIRVFGSAGQVGWHDTPLVKGPGVIVGRKGNAGAVSRSPSDFFPIDTAFYVRPLAAELPLSFLFHLLSHQNLAAIGADSAVPGLNRNLAYMSQVLRPPPEVLTAFDRAVASLHALVDHNDQEVKTLADLRDLLLPKLLSGELRVRDAEGEIEKVA